VVVRRTYDVSLLARAGRWWKRRRASLLAAKSVKRFENRMLARDEHPEHISRTTAELHAVMDAL
jgi:hypothetical protein